MTTVRRRPILRSFEGFQRGWLSGDLLAGVVLAAILIPQGMAYAEIAGLPAVNGLYATVAALVAFALLGGSRNLVLGPDSSTAALVGATLLPLAAAGTDRYVALAGTLALLVGVLFIGARLAHLAFLSDFLAGPIITGYQAGLGLTITIGQLPKLLGFSVDADRTITELVETVRHLGDTVGISLVVGALSLAAILAIGRLAPKLPNILIVVVLATAAAWALDLANHGLALLGKVPSGFPPLGLPDLERGDLPLLLAGAVGIALVSFTDTVVEARTAAARGDFDPDVDQDMIGVAAADLANGLASGFPLSASGSRTVVVQTAGARSQLANLAAASVVLVVLVVATGPLEYIPNTVLAAVIIAAALRLISVPALQRLWRMRRTEFAVAVVTGLSVVFIGILQGIAIAVAFAIVNVLRRLARPNSEVLGRVDGRSGYHTLSRHPDATTTPGVVVFRFDAPLFFANANEFASQVRRMLAEHAGAHAIVIDAAGITDIDTTAAEVLEDLFGDLHARAVTIAIADAPGRVEDELGRYGLRDGEDAPLVTDTIDEAVQRLSSS